MRLLKLVPRAGTIAAVCPLCAHPLEGLLVQGALQRHPLSVAGAVADAVSGPPYLCPSNLLLETLMRLPKLVPRAGAIAAVCPPCAHPLEGLLLQGAPLRHPKSVACAVADAATSPPHLCPSNLLLEALMRLPKFVPRVGAVDAACPPFAQPLAGVLVQGAPLRYPETVAGTGADAVTGTP